MFGMIEVCLSYMPVTIRDERAEFLYQLFHYWWCCSWNKYLIKNSFCVSGDPFLHKHCMVVTFQTVLASLMCSM